MPNDMENPYQSPNPFRDDVYERRPAVPPGMYDAGLVHHIRIVAILMCVQGVFELLGAGFTLLMGIVMAMMMSGSTEMSQAPGAPTPFLFLGIYGVMGLALLVTGGLHLFAGIRNYQLQGRTLGIVALAAGMLDLAFCYCLPTSIGLLVYGLIVYLNPQVTAAFSMRESGAPAADVLMTFTRYPR
jgi:hypothetical protein